MPNIKIALIAHDGKKAEMVNFLLTHLELLKKPNISLVATGTTGNHVAEAGLQVERVLSGPLGGDAQIATQVANGEIDMVLFFRDPLGKHPHEPDINMLLRLCDVHDKALATNPSTAKMLFRALDC